MENEFTEWLAALQIFWGPIERFLMTLTLPSRQIQVAVIVALMGLSWLIGRALATRLEAWTRQQTGLPKWRLRVLAVARRRMGLFVFVLLLWVAVWVFSQLYSFPSRRQLLVLAATIATAWLGIRLAAQLVRNRFVRQIVISGLSTYAVLYYMGLLEPAAQSLDGLAITFGDFRLSVLALLKAVVLTAVLFTVARMITNSATARIRRNRDLSPSVRELTVKMLQVVLFGAAIFIGLKSLGFDLTGLAVLSGAIGLGLGFGLQKVVSNLVSGVIILLDKSVKPGDVISLGETFGWIDSLGARYVSVVTRDGREYLIPNEDLITGQVVNWSHSNEFVRLDLFFGTSYNDDPHQVRRLAVEAALTVERVLSDRAPVCHIVGFGDSSVDYILRFWIRDPTMGLTNIRGNVYLALWDAFKAAGVSIPFPQREIRVLKDTGAADGPGPTDGPGPQGAMPGPDIPPHRG